MKKSLILLPFAALLLTGCGDEEKKPEPVKPLDPTDSTIPAGGEEVDIKNEEKRNEVVNKLANNVVVSYNSLKSGFIAESFFKVNELSVLEDNLNFKAVDLGFNFKLTALGLDKAISEWQIAAEMSNFKGQVVINENNPKSKKIFEASNISLGIYLDKGNLYADFSNPNLINLANSIIEYAVPAQGLVEAKQYASMALKKLKIENIFSFVGVKLDTKLPEFPLEELADFKKEALEGLANLPKGLGLQILNYEKNGLGAVVSYSKKQNDSEKIGNDTYVTQDLFNINGNILFNEAGKLAKIYAKETINNFVKVNDVVEESVVADFEEGIAFAFGISEISLPDFSAFETFPLSAILELVPSSTSVSLSSQISEKTID